MGSLQARDASRKFNHRHLHPKTKAKIRNLFLPRVFCRSNLSFDASLSETAGDKNSIYTSQEGIRSLLLNLLRVDFDKINSHVFA